MRQLRHRDIREPAQGPGVNHRAQVESQGECPGVCTQPCITPWLREVTLLSLGFSDRQSEPGTCRAGPGVTVLSAALGRSRGPRGFFTSCERAEFSFVHICCNTGRGGGGSAVCSQLRRLQKCFSPRHPTKCQSAAHRYPDVLGPFRGEGATQKERMGI